MKHATYDWLEANDGGVVCVSLKEDYVVVGYFTIDELLKDYPTATKGEGVFNWGAYRFTEKLSMSIDNEENRIINKGW